MMVTESDSGFLHEIPDDMQELFSADAELLAKRNALTPLGRNEWICRVTIVKKEETRHEHLQRLVQDLGKGKKRPCCWPGCPHRKKG